MRDDTKTSGQGKGSGGWVVFRPTATMLVTAWVMPGISVSRRVLRPAWLWFPGHDVRLLRHAMQHATMRWQHAILMVSSSTSLPPKRPRA